jgi:hypothetical protein
MSGLNYTNLTNAQRNQLLETVAADNRLKRGISDETPIDDCVSNHFSEDYLYLYSDILRWASDYVKETNPVVYDALVSAGTSKPVTDMVSKHESLLGDMGYVSPDQSYTIDTSEKLIINGGARGAQRGWLSRHSTVNMGVNIDSFLNNGQVFKNEMVRWDGGQPKVKLVRFETKGSVYYSLADGFQRTTAYCLLRGLYLYNAGTPWADILKHIPVTGLLTIADDIDEMNMLTYNIFNEQRAGQSLSKFTEYKAMPMSESEADKIRYALMQSVMDKAGVEFVSEKMSKAMLKNQFVNPDKHIENIVLKGYPEPIMVEAYKIAKQVFLNTKISAPSVMTILNVLTELENMYRPESGNIIEHELYPQLRDLMLRSLSLLWGETPNNKEPHSYCKDMWKQTYFTTVSADAFSSKDDWRMAYLTLYAMALVDLGLLNSLTPSINYDISHFKTVTDGNDIKAELSFKQSTFGFTEKNITECGEFNSYVMYLDSVEMTDEEKELQSVMKAHPGLSREKAREVAKLLKAA